MQHFHLFIYRRKHVKKWYPHWEKNVVKTEDKTTLHFETNYTEFNPNFAANSFELVQAPATDN